MPEILDDDFMRRALLAAALVGLAAPVVGIFLVQRRLSLIGDGLGHVALAGVTAGLLTGRAPVWTAWRPQWQPRSSWRRSARAGVPAATSSSPSSSTEASPAASS